MSTSVAPVVLIVEDEPDVAETYERWLTDYDVRWVETGDQALAQLDESVDVVLLIGCCPACREERYLRRFVHGRSTVGWRW
ncbi:two-component system response regulator [Haladaptatus sp. DYSN1]|uniref:response regulator n=1 Tax=unclassified Haladaptatus TaxID=2622732 RepID=UPI0024049A60|nr:hypothetical protein [Haladaptatus sp. DYSN1]